jgi:hypothetical protein
LYRRGAATALQVVLSVRRRYGASAEVFEAIRTTQGKSIAQSLAGD